MSQDITYPPGPTVSLPTVALIQGDGIGPEITRATLRVIEAAGGAIEWEPVPAGMAALDSDKDPLPQRTLDAIARNRLALKGPLATPIGGGFRSVNVALRQHFDLYANVRPVRTIAGVPSRFENVDIVLVRENTEDLYAGIEHYVDPRRTAAESIAIITRYGSERIIRYAFEYARQHGRKKVTLVHKANILKMSNGLFLDVGREVAAEYGDIEFGDMIVDATAMKLVIQPEFFDVIVTMNLFGDILSDLTAGLVGGLGVAPAANIGEGGLAIFEAVHGTAPDIAGKGIANPTGLMLSAVLLLEHIGQGEAAARMRSGIMAALASDTTRTGDLGGKASTVAFTDAVVAALS
jgi:isocitrate dehydrogenase (NAD+)